MTTIFYDYLTTLLNAPESHLKNLGKQWFETIENQLKEDEKKPIKERSINSEPANQDDLGYITTPLQRAFWIFEWLEHESAERKHLFNKLIKLYIKYSDLTIQGEYGHALCYAARYSSYCGIDVVKEIINKNPKLVTIPSNFEGDWNGSYPLSIAVIFSKNDDCVKLLLEEGKADPNLQDQNKEGWTPLHHAVYRAQESIVRLLLQRNVDTQLCSKKYNEKAIEVIKEHSVSEYDEGREDYEELLATAQEYDARRKSVEKLIKEYEAQKEYETQPAAFKLAQPLDAASNNEDPIYPMTAIFHNYVAELLATPENQLKEERIPIWLQKIQQELQTDQEKPVEERNINKLAHREGVKSSKTPLQLAIETTDQLRTNDLRKPVLKQLIKLYLDCSDLSIQGSLGHALCYAAKYSSDCGVDVVNEIINRNPELISVPNNFSNGSDLSRLDWLDFLYQGSYPLSIACADNSNCIEVLLKAGANPDLQNIHTGWTALHAAIFHTANETVVHLLLKRKANTQLEDKDKKRAIDVPNYYSFFSLQHLTEEFQAYNDRRKSIESCIQEYEKIQNVASDLTQHLAAASNNKEQVEAIKTFSSKSKDILAGITNSSIFKLINTFVTATLVTALATTVGFGVGFALGWWTGPGAFFAGLAAGAYAETIVTAVGVATGVAAGGIKAYGLFKTVQGTNESPNSSYLQCR